MTNPQGNAWNLAYDPMGNLTSVSDSMPTRG
jgi:YD repeat-containing protein